LELWLLHCPQCIQKCELELPWPWYKFPHALDFVMSRKLMKRI
jgi:hypothetical protein